MDAHFLLSWLVTLRIAWRCRSICFWEARKSTHAVAFVEKAVDRAILGYADQQIITGLAILIADFSQLRTVDMYHSHIVVYLAWMSSNTYLSAVSLLQDEFRANKWPKMKTFRVISMFFTGVLLLVALVPKTGAVRNINTYSPRIAPGWPARRFWHKQALERF